jgi:hypothetical protein
MTTSELLSPPAVAMRDAAHRAIAALYLARDVSGDHTIDFQSITIDLGAERYTVTVETLPSRLAEMEQAHE